MVYPAITVPWEDDEKAMQTLSSAMDMILYRIQYTSYWLQSSLTLIIVSYY